MYLEGKTMRTRRLLLSVAVVIAVSTQALAVDIELPPGRVTWIETTYMPNWIYFQLSSGDARCPSGTALVWRNGSVDNTKANLATLFTSYLSGKPVRAVYQDTVVGTYAPGMCLMTYLGLQ